MLMNSPAVAEDTSLSDDHRVLELPLRKPSGEVRIDVHAAIDDVADRAAFRAGLIAKPATSSPKFFYDPQGSALFTAILLPTVFAPLTGTLFQTASQASMVGVGVAVIRKAKNWREISQSREARPGIYLAGPLMRRMPNETKKQTMPTKISGRP